MDVTGHGATQRLDKPDEGLVWAAFEAVPDGLMVVENNHVLLANIAAAKLLGYEGPASLVAQPIDRFFPRGLFRGDLPQISPETPCEYPACEWQIRRADQQEVQVAVQLTSLRSGSRALLLIAFQETQRRAEAGTILRNVERRFRAIFDGAAIGIGTCTLDGHIIETNPALAKMLGYDAEELIGMNAREFHPEDFREPEGFREEESLLLPQLMLGSRDSFDLEKRFRRKDGTSLWGHLTVSLVRDSSGKPGFAIVMLEDTTERKRDEEQLRQAEKMEVIGRLAGGIAHDFNNLLTGILLYCDLVLSGPESEEQLRRHVEEIRLAGEQGAALTQQLLSIARKQPPQLRTVQLNEVISSTENLLRRLIGEQLELVSALAPDPDPVMADPGQLRQVLLNLVLNARDAMPNGGRITVSTHSRTLPGGGHPAVSLLVADTGHGMDAQTRARLFEPFFTTKTPGQGTGLGLTTVQRIVKEASGTIEVESEIGQGTRIEVFFPAVQHLAPASLPPAASPRTSETILLVDDHAGARHSMQRVLDQAGYRVLTASSGPRGLAIFADHEDEIDLLLADWMMPGMSGRELANRLRQRKPGLRVLFISGYLGAHDEPEALSVPLIRKPVDGSALLGRIREVLDLNGDLPCS